MKRASTILDFTLLIGVLPLFVFAADRPSLAELERIVTKQESEITKMAERARIADERIKAIEEARSTISYEEALKRAKENFKIDKTKCNATQQQIDAMIEVAATQLMANDMVRQGKKLGTPIVISCKVGVPGAGGATTFSFKGNGPDKPSDVFGWDMKIQGPIDRLLGSVVPHEMCHVLNALDCRRPLVRAFDEGLAILYEEDSERRRQLKLAQETMGTRNFIPIHELLRIMDYPKDMRKVLVLYAEGAVLSDFIVTRAAGNEAWTREEARRFMIGLMDAASKRGFDAAFYEYRDKLGGISSVAQFSSEFEKWMKSGKADIYHFAPPAGR